MKDSDLLDLHLPITVRQAKYLRRKYHELARQKLLQAKMEGSHFESSESFLDHVMLEGLSAQLAEKLGELPESG